MPPRSSDTQSTLCILPRRSPRFLVPNFRCRQPETAPSTPTRGSGNKYQVSTRSTTVSRSSSLRKSNKKDQNDESDKSSTKLVAINRGSSRNGEISVSRTPRSSNGVEGILGLRRSPRFHKREIDADKTCADECNRSSDCRTPGLKSRVGGILGLEHCPRFSNPEISRDTSSHEDRGFISNGDASLSAVDRRNGRVTRSSVASRERRERESRHINGGRVKDNDSSEMKAKRVINDGPAAKGKNGVLKKKCEGDMQQARCHSSSHLERGPKKANATAVALEAGGEKEVLKERENDGRKQGKGGSNKHSESRLRKARGKSEAVRPEGGRIEIEYSYGKENEGGNASTQFNVKPRQSRSKDKLRVKENDDSEMMLRGANVAPVLDTENAVPRERGKCHMQHAGCHFSNHLKRQPKKRSKDAIKTDPETRGAKAIHKVRKNDDMELVRGDPSKNPKNRLTRLMRGKYLSVRPRQVAERDDGKENKGGDISTASDVEPVQGERKDNLKKLSTGTRVIGAKRKRKDIVAIQKTEQGWTQEQEMALQRAYFSAKPTPQFWKKVARLVPGKSAQDCFDKVHSDNLTPPSSRIRSRTKDRILSPVSRLSFSASKLLKSPEANGKKACKNKQKSHIVHRNVRHMLEKYCQADKDNRPDLFSVLEPAVDKSALLTPAPFLVNLGSSPVSCQISSSGKKKRLSRFSAGSGTALTSPPVLKQVKNVALHEKYIDQLHIREAKRKAASKHNAKCISIEENKMETPVQHKDVIKAARNALVSDACDAISKFKSLQQINLMDEFSDREEYFNDEDEEDDTL